jgi:hypothetical protein
MSGVLGDRDRLDVVVALRRLANIRTAADKTDKNMIAWRSKCARINDAWQRIQREADAEFTVDTSNEHKAAVNAKRRGQTPPVFNRERHRAFVEAEVIYLAEDVRSGRYDK